MKKMEKWTIFYFIDIFTFIASLDSSLVIIFLFLLHSLLFFLFIFLFNYNYSNKSLITRRIINKKNEWIRKEETKITKKNTYTFKYHVNIVINEQKVYK